MVVWVEARAEVRTARTTSLSQGDHRGPHRKVGYEQDHRAGDGREARRGLAVLRLLGQVYRALPAPVDKDPDQEPADKGAGVIDSEGREPRDFRNERLLGSRAPVNFRQCHEGEEQESPDLGDDQDVLEVGR